MHITFVLVKDWEKKIIRRKFRGHTVVFLDEDLTEENVAKIKKTEILSVFIATKVTKKIIAKLPKLQMIATRSTGYDHIDLKAAKKKKISVFNVPSYGENTVAEHTFALILALSRKVHESYIRKERLNFSIEGLKGFDLSEKTIGVIGVGNIGKHVIRIARGFNMKVLAYDRHPDRFLSEEMNFEYVSYDKLIKESDIITLHVPYNKENHHMINKKLISKMKDGVVLINTSRGGLIDTESLIDALRSKKVSGAGLDVIEGEELIKEEKELLHSETNTEKLEQLIEDHILISMNNVVFTPHIAFYSEEALMRIIEDTIDSIKRFIKGNPSRSKRVV